MHRVINDDQVPEQAAALPTQALSAYAQAPTLLEVALPEETEDGTQLVFPSAFRLDLPSAAEPLGDRQLKLRRS